MMDRMATTRRALGVQLAGDAGLAEVIEVVNELSATLAGRLAVSPSDRLSDAHPSASIVYSDREYDALAERLEGPPTPNDRLRRTMFARATTDR
jgi:hypothetical protein